MKFTKYLLALSLIAAMGISCSDSDDSGTDQPGPTPEPTVVYPELPADPQPDQYTGFVQRVMLLQHTGNECGYCPYMTAGLVAVTSDSEYADKIVMVSAHNYSASDPCYHRSAMQVASYLRVPGAPYVTPNLRSSLNFTNGSNIEANIETIKRVVDTELSTYPVKAGISAAAVLNQDNNTVDVRIGVKVGTAGRYKYSAWLLEDGVYATQTKYSVAGSTLPSDIDFNTHGNVLRGGNINGAPTVPGAQLGENEDFTIAANSTVEQTLSIEIPSSVDLTHDLKVIVAVNTPDTESGSVYNTNNIIVCPVGGNVAYQYAQ